MLSQLTFRPSIFRLPHAESVYTLTILYTLTEPSTYVLSEIWLLINSLWRRLLFIASLNGWLCELNKHLCFKPVVAHFGFIRWSWINCSCVRQQLSICVSHLVKRKPQFNRHAESSWTVDWSSKLIRIDAMCADNNTLNVADGPFNPPNFRLFASHKRICLVHKLLI